MIASYYRTYMYMRSISLLLVIASANTVSKQHNMTIVYERTITTTLKRQFKRRRPPIHLIVVSLFQRNDKRFLIISKVNLLWIQ